MSKNGIDNSTPHGEPVRPMQGAKSSRQRYGRRALQQQIPFEELSTQSFLLAQFEDVVKKNKDNYERLPIFEITSVRRPQRFELLPVSDDESLLEAIQASKEEVEQDADVREQALLTLQTFRTRNSLVAISDVALYDLSAKLRSLAVTALAKLDHESVFETILLACTDPTREVRAAASRGLFNLSCDRTEAWLRISESGDQIAINQGGRSVVAGDLVNPALDRLIHSERQFAAEAFAIVRLLIKAGETKEILERVSDCQNLKIAKAILHVIKLSSDIGVNDDFSALLETTELQEEIRDEITEILLMNENAEMAKLWA